LEIINLKEPRVQDPVDTFADLSRRLRDSDRSAFAEVFRRFHAPLVRYARRITSDDEAAYDVLQDVFMKLWEDRQRLTVKVSLQAMLYTMVRNRALNSLRRNKWIATAASVENAHDGHEAAPHPRRVAAEHGVAVGRDDDPVAAGHLGVELVGRPAGVAGVDPELGSLLGFLLGAFGELLQELATLAGPHVVEDPKGVVGLSIGVHEQEHLVRQALDG